MMGVQINIGDDAFWFRQVKGGTQEMRKVKFFKTMDWAALLRHELTAPYDPFVNYPEDTSNFDEYPDSKDQPEGPTFEDGAADPFANFA